MPRSVKIALNSNSYFNLHKFIREEQLHDPRGFEGAGNSYGVYKDIHGYLNWDVRLYQPTVDSFISLSSTVTPTDGARYIVTGTTALSSTANFGGAPPNAIVEYITLDPDGASLNQWNYISPTKGMLCYLDTEDKFYYWDGNSWNDILSSGGGGGTSDSFKKELVLNGTAGNGAVGYVDIVTPSNGSVVDKVEFLTVAGNLTPNTGTPQIKAVLFDGSDTDLTGNIPVNELNSAKLYKENAAIYEVASQSIRLKISGANISGNLTVKITYF